VGKVGLELAYSGKNTKRKALEHLFSS